MSTILTIYLILGVAAALYADWETRSFSSRNPLASILPEVTIPQRIFQAIVVLFLWPLILIKKIVVG